MPTLLIVGATALLIGLAIGWITRYWYAIYRRSSLELDIKEKSLQAEEKALKIIEKAEEKAAAIEQETKATCKTLEEKLEQKENRLNKKEELLDQRQIEVDSQVENVRTKIEEVKAVKARLDDHKKELDAKLEEVAGLSQEEAYERLINVLEKSVARIFSVACANSSAWAKSNTKNRPAICSWRLFTVSAIPCRAML